MLKLVASQDNGANKLAVIEREKVFLIYLFVYLFLKF